MGLPTGQEPKEVLLPLLHRSCPGLLYVLAVCILSGDYLIPLSGSCDCTCTVHGFPLHKPYPLVKVVTLKRGSQYDAGPRIADWSAAMQIIAEYCIAVLRNMSTHSQHDATQCNTSPASYCEPGLKVRALSMDYHSTTLRAMSEYPRVSVCSVHGLPLHHPSLLSEYPSM